MLTASQDIDSFIERQRNQLNKQNSRQGGPQRPVPQPAPPPPISSGHQQNNYQDRLDVRVARILDEPGPRGQQPAQQYYPPDSSSYPSNDYSDQYNSYDNEQSVQQQPPQDFRRPINDNRDDNPVAFFNKFGTYDDKRSQLKDDLKREYNEYLQSKQRGSKSKSTSQINSPRGQPNNNRRGPVQSNGSKVVAPWEKGESKTTNNSQSLQDLSIGRSDYPTNRSRAPVPMPLNRNQDEQYVRDREAYISELHTQIRELEARKKQLEFESNRLSGGSTSNQTRAHYREDLNALNSLLAERLDQRNAVDIELAHILNRPPVSASPTRLGSGAMPQLDMPMDQSFSNQQAPRYPPNNHRQAQPMRTDRRKPPGDSGFVIGQEVDKDSEQAAKKRYQQELQAQMREVQIRKAHDKREKDEYDRKLDAEIQKYNYFGRSGGGAPMRDRDGNVVANLSDLRNPPQSTGIAPDHGIPTDRGFPNGSGPSSIKNSPFYNGDQQAQSSFPSAPTDRSGSPNHARGAVSNGIFGNAKTEDQLAREERYKLDLKKQIDEKRQRELEEAARRRAEEDREMAKHLQWQQQMEQQMADEAARKQEKEAHERMQQQQMQEELERQRQQEDAAARRKPKRVEKASAPKREETNDEQLKAPASKYIEVEPAPKTETAFRSSSPPVPTIKNKGKKGKKKNLDPDNDPAPPPPRRQSYDEDAQQRSPPPPPLEVLSNEDELIEPPYPEDTRSIQGQQTYRKPPTPRQPDITSARKRPPPTNQNRIRPNSNTGVVLRTNSSLSLRSDGSDSEVLNRLEHLKRQLKDKEARLQEHVIRHQTETSSSNDAIEASRSNYQTGQTRKQSPAFMMNAARVRPRDSPTNLERGRRLIQADDDLEYKPSYFRDDTILMSGITGAERPRLDPLQEKRRNSGEEIFGSNIEREASRRRYGYERKEFYDHEDPTALANIELNRIAEQNEQRLKKLRDLENDDASLLDSNEVLERFQQRQRLQRGGSQTTLQDDTWFK